MATVTAGEQFPVKYGRTGFHRNAPEILWSATEGQHLSRRELHGRDEFMRGPTPTRCANIEQWLQGFARARGVLLLAYKKGDQAEALMAELRMLSRDLDEQDRRIEDLFRQAWPEGDR